MRDKRLLIGVGVIVALVAFFFIFRPGDDDETGTGTTTTAVTEPTTTETATTAAPEATQLVVTIRGGEPVDGIVRAEARKGDRVVVIVRSDVADEVHVHGYDLMADVAPGKPVRIEFTANLTGRFEIELEGRGKQIAQLTVLP
jgi:heme/copper-type cytochrome/quinol oxidase subunit 2